MKKIPGSLYQYKIYSDGIDNEHIALCLMSQYKSTHFFILWLNYSERTLYAVAHDGDYHDWNFKRILQ